MNCPIISIFPKLRVRAPTDILIVICSLSGVVKAPRTFDGATCTKVNWGRVSMKESSKVELD